MKLRKSQRMKAKIKMALQGSSGSGKTMSALLLAKGLTNNQLEKVAVIDTENGSSDLYAHLGNYNVLSLEPPYSPEKYIEAIGVCLNAGMEVIILDSTSHCWEYLLDFHSKLPGNSFTNWNKITPMYKSFVNKILQSPAHFISTMRTKQDYVLNQKNGKYIPEKVGLKAIQRDGVEYEYTIVFDIDSKHFTTCSKDRTGLFSGKPDFKISEETGKAILKWCNNPLQEEDIFKRINESLSIKELMDLYKDNPEYRVSHKVHFQEKKKQLEELTHINQHQKNGTAIS